MTTIYMRTRNDEGKRTWVKVGIYAPNSDPEIEGTVMLQITPGMVYHARIMTDDLVKGNLG